MEKIIITILLGLSHSIGDPQLQKEHGMIRTSEVREQEVPANNCGGEEKEGMEKFNPKNSIIFKRQSDLAGFSNLFRS